MLVSKFIFFPKIPSSASATATAFPSNSRRDLFVLSTLSDENSNWNTNSNSNSNSNLEPEIQLKPAKFRASPQLARWSRARSIRSGHRFHRPPLLTKTESPTSLETSSPSSSDDESDGGKIQPSISSEYDADDGDSEQEDDENAMAGGKPIYMVSDGTGWTAEHTVNAALGQFENCLVDRGCPVNTHLFSGVQDVDKLLEIIKQAAREGALLLYTLVDPSMAESAKEACKVWDVPATDILGPTTEAIAAHLGVAPSGIPRGAPGRKAPLTAEYFRRIEAIDFTIKQDDGAQPQNITRADIVLVGVSRTGKTPLSIYLAQKGYKVANIPIVMGVDLPKTLFQIKQEKIFGLTINPVVLQTIRRARAKTLGFNGDTRNNYSEMDYVREELEYANRIYSRNPMWPVIEVTGKAIEETAAVIVRMYHDRKQMFSMPSISRRY